MYLVKICLNDKLLPCALKNFFFMKYRYSDRVNKQQIQKDKTIPRYPVGICDCYKGLCN